MRNLKKVLALVLALVMALGLMSVASAKTSFTDDASITAAYREGVEVLTGLKVYQGKNSKDTFAPGDTITRAEVAAIIYRLVTGDVTDAKSGTFAGWANFADVKAKGDNYWASGYIGYCANAQYIIGDKVNFYPDMEVTGYQALAMILRAMGYDQNKEFQGSGWEIKVASTARERNILKNITEGQLISAASREMVADLLFQAANQAIVTYTSALGYNKYQDTLSSANSVENDCLGWTVFSLTSEPYTDDWGRPGTRWFRDLEERGGKVYTPLTKDVSVATVMDKPDASYTTAVSECKIAEDVGLKTDVVFDLVVNAAPSVEYNVQRADEVQMLGGQGTLTEVYYDAVNQTGTIVCIDTFLAKVVGKTDIVYDNAGATAGHVAKNARLTLLVYNSDGTDVKALWNETTANGAAGTYGYIESSTKNYTQSVGDMVLVNARTVNTDPDDDGTQVVGQFLSAVKDDETEIDVTAATDVNDAGKVAGVLAGLAKETGKNDDVANKFKLLEVLTTAPTAVVGAQNTRYANEPKHKVAGTDYDDAKWLALDQAGTEVVDHTWYLDQYGNLIGIVNEIAAAKYGVIEQIQWINGTLETGYALAKMRYMDNTTETVKVKDIDAFNDEVFKTKKNPLTYAESGDKGDYGTGKVATTLQYNYWVANNDNDGKLGFKEAFTGRDLFKAETNKDGTVSLTHVTYVDDGKLIKGEAKEALVVRGNPVIICTGVTTDVDDEEFSLKANNKTVFMVREKDGFKATYTTYTGVDKVPSFLFSEDGVDIDYIDLNSDGFVDYVYIISDADSNVTAGLLLLTSNNVKVVLDEDGQPDHYEVQGYLDHVYSDSIKVAVDTTDAGDDGVYDTPASIIEQLVPSFTAPDTEDNYKNKGFLVFLTDGEISAVGIGTAPDVLGNPWDIDAKLTLGYYVDDPDKMTVAEIGSMVLGKIGNENYTTFDELIYLSGTILTEGDGQNDEATVRYSDGYLIITHQDESVTALDATGVTPIMGSWAPDLTTKDVYVVYATSPLTGLPTTVKAVYIIDLPSEAESSATTNGDLRITSGATSIVYDSGDLQVDGVAIKNSASSDQTFDITTKVTALSYSADAKNYTSLAISKDLLKKAESEEAKSKDDATTKGVYELTAAAEGAVTVGTLTAGHYKATIEVTISWKQTIDGNEVTFSDTKTTTVAFGV